VCHSNIKPVQLLASIIEGDRLRVPMVDMTSLDGPGSGHIISKTYAPPEALAVIEEVWGAARHLSDTTGFAFDVWSIGVTAAHVALGSHPFAPTQKEVEAYGMEWVSRDQMVVDNVLTKRRAGGHIFHPHWGLLDEDLKEFVDLCLKVKAKERPTVEQLKETAWGRRAMADDGFAWAGLEGEEGLFAGVRQPDLRVRWLLSEANHQLTQHRGRVDEIAKKAAAAEHQFEADAVQMEVLGQQIAALEARVKDGRREARRFHELQSGQARSAGRQLAVDRAQIEAQGERIAALERRREADRAVQELQARRIASLGRKRERDRAALEAQRLQLQEQACILADLLRWRVAEEARRAAEGAARGRLEEARAEAVCRAKGLQRRPRSGVWSAPTGERLRVLQESYGRLSGGDDEEGGRGRCAGSEGTEGGASLRDQVPAAAVAGSFSANDDVERSGA
jgi:hypothetical protein